MGPNYIPGKKEHFFPRKKILGMLLFAGLRQEPVESVSVVFFFLSPRVHAHCHTPVHCPYTNEKSKFFYKVKFLCFLDTGE
jgi:hypothetical protein